MQSYEYKVLPAPKKGRKSKGVKGNEARFAHALEHLMNEMGAEGWEYQRADTLPCEEREGLMSRTTVFQTMLVFRRAVAADTGAEASDAAQPAMSEPEPEEDAQSAAARIARTLEPEAQPTADTAPRAPKGTGDESKLAAE